MENKSIKIAVVVPCFNESAMLSPQKENGKGCLFLDALYGVKFKQTVYLYPVFVDDGSSDDTSTCIKNLCKEYELIHYLSFSRNFGKESALYAGLEKALSLPEKVDYVATMDADLQDPPSLLPDMLDCILSGEYDSVATRRVTRKGEPPIRSFFARMFYRIINKISDIEIVDGSRDYRLMPRKMVDAIVSLKEVNRFSKGLFQWVGFKTKWFEYENVERAAGETKWSFWKLFKYSLEGIVSFSTAPLAIASVLGIITCIASFLYLIVILVKTLAFGEVVAGYPSLMCVILFLGGVQLISIGIIGQYLAKTYTETKKRPIFIIREEK